MKQLNYDVCDKINKVCMKSYREDMMWKRFVFIIGGRTGRSYNFDKIKEDKWAKVAKEIIYDVYDTKQKKDSLCKVFWYMFMNSIEEDEWTAYGEMLCSNKDKMFKIIDKYFVVNAYEEIVPTNENLIDDNTIRFKKNGDVDKRCKAWKKYGFYKNGKSYIAKRQMNRNFYISDDFWMENYETYELPKEERNDGEGIDWK